MGCVQLASCDTPRETFGHRLSESLENRDISFRGWGLKNVILVYSTASCSCVVFAQHYAKNTEKHGYYIKKFFTALLVLLPL